MELKLIRQHHEYMQVISPTPINCETMREHIVPDSCSDIARIVDTYGHVCITGRELGSDGRICVTGSVDVSVLYIPEKGSGLSVLQFRLPFQCIGDSQCGSDAELISIRCELHNLDTRVLNPRKILTRANMTLFPECYKRANITVGTTVQDKEDLEILHCRRKTRFLTSVQEKEFTFREEITSPGGREMEQIIHWRFDVRSADCKLIGTKLVLKGSAAVTVLCRTVDGALQTLRGEYPFSQIMDGSGLQEEWEFDCDFQTLSFDCRIGTESEPDDRNTADFTLQLRVLVSACSHEEIAFISDLYGTNCTVSCNTEELELQEEHSRYVKRLNVRETLETAAAVKTVLDTVVTSGTAHIDTAAMHVEIPLWVTCLFQDEEDAMHSARREFTVRCPLEHEPQLVCKCTVHSGSDILTSIVPDGIEIRCPLECTVDAHKRSSYISVCGGEIEEDVSKGTTPSIILRRIGEEESLWSVAKAYRSTVRAILAINELQDEQQIPRHKPILIPCKR